MLKKKEIKSLNEKVDYLFAQIKFKQCFLDSQVINIMNDLKKDILVENLNFANNCIEKISNDILDISRKVQEEEYSKYVLDGYWVCSKFKDYNDFKLKELGGLE